MNSLGGLNQTRKPSSWGTPLSVVNLIHHREIIIDIIIIDIISFVVFNFNYIKQIENMI